MGLKRYSVLMVLLLVAVWFFVNSQNSDYFTVVQFGFSQSLAVSSWVIIPAVIVFLLSVFHMAFYSFKGFMADRKQRKDMDNFKYMIESKILDKEDTEQNFKTENFKEVGELCRLLKFDEDKSTTDIHSEEIDSFLDVVKDVKSGKIVDLKKYQLKDTNPIFIKNQENILEDDPIEAKEILKNYTEKESQICQKAFLKFVTFATKKEIIESGYIVNKEAFETIIDRYINSELELSIEDITTYLTNFTYSSKEFIELAKRLKAKLNPDAVIVFYDKLYASYPEALEGYLYLLFELQMIDSIREIITDCDAPVCKKYEYLLFLRDSGKNFHIELFT